MSAHLTVTKEHEFSYEIRIEHDFSNLSEAVTACGLSGRKACIVTDSNVGPLYEEAVIEELEKVCTSVTVYTFPAGESSKNLETVNGVYEHLIQEQFDRKDFLVALGGGVTGDLTGYAAATYLRGISFVQIPTSLLAQVDSSIGGKTGVDFQEYKNMVGAFHQPSLVYMNLSALSTLPALEFASGMAEILKHGLIKDEPYYAWIINNMFEIDDREPEVLEEMILRSCEIKKEIVEKDPKEQGERALLNLGHTIGHAIEKLKGFQLKHGECVALGTIAAAYISYKRELITVEEMYEIRDMNVGFYLPMTFEGLEPDDILAATKMDKKMDNGKIKFVLLKGIGEAFIDDTVTDEEILDAIDSINGDRIDHE